MTERWYRAEASLLEQLALAPLLPLAGLFALGARLRRAGYDAGLLRSTAAPIPVLSVGNLVVGGAGKTPVVLALLERLAARGLHAAVLSRGYGGAGRGARIVSRRGERLLSALDAGDEPSLLAARAPSASVLVGPSRLELARLAHAELHVDVAVLDDGLQHLALRRDVELVVLEAAAPFGNGWSLPRGPLREGAHVLSRADLVWLSRCDEAEPAALAALVARVEAATGRPPVQARYRPTALLDGALRPVGTPAELSGRRVLLLSGLARPQSFRRTVEALGAEVRLEQRLADHAAPDEARLRELLEQAARDEAWLLCTEKDAVKLPAALADEPRLRALRIDSELIAGADGLDALLAAAVPGAPHA